MHSPCGWGPATARADQATSCGPPLAPGARGTGPPVSDVQLLLDTSLVSLPSAPCLPFPPPYVPFVPPTYVCTSSSFEKRRHHDYCPQEYLQWSYRAPRILRELEQYDPDVLCLQVRAALRNAVLCTACRGASGRTSEATAHCP